MNLQYISDNKGKTTGVFIPIEEWNELRAKYKGIENEEIEIPDWQKKEVDDRIRRYKSNIDNAMDFNEAMNEIENNL
ncbi:MAG: addiction module protein [Saprospiraceae bacterium]